MDIQSQLQSVRLKKVEPVSSRPAVVANEDVSTHQHLLMDANAEEWEGPLKHCTFPTSYLSLSRKDAQALMVQNIRWHVSAGIVQEHEAVELVPQSDESLLEIDWEPHLRELEEKLQSKLDELAGSEKDCSFFVKSSCRSPKDAPAFSSKVETLYRGRLQQSETKDMNAQLDAMYFSGIQCMKVRHASEVLELFSTSRRIRTDLFIALQPEMGSREWNQNLVIRKWVDIEPDMEFRGFVHERQFHALCQYNHLLLSPRLVKQKEEIGQRMYKFWQEHIDPHLAEHEKLQSYIVDFALTGDNLEEIWVIELNPFLDTTSPILFSWTRDNTVLREGPWDFRITEKSSPGLLASLEPEWRDRLKQWST